MEFVHDQDVWQWLAQRPHIDALIARFPADWQQVGPRLVAALEGGDPQQLAQLAGAARARELAASHTRNAQALREAVQGRMLLAALDAYALAAATGQKGGTVRFNAWNGWLIQRLLFARGLTRKPASRGAFRFWWRFVTQKRFLMPLVQKKGIFCFYTRELIAALAQRIAGRRTLEIAAGDGTLTRFLAAAGVDVRATDDHSWSHAVTFPPEVERLDAAQALARHRPQVVLCSWPPPGNRFEAAVFTTPGVELYVVIGSAHRFASGNWDAYRDQRGFDWQVDREFSALVLPPELDTAVLVFTRAAATA